MQNVFKRTNTLRITHHISTNNAPPAADGVTAAMNTLSLGSIQTSFDPTRQDLELLNGMTPLTETTPFLAFSMAKAVKANEVDLIERLLARGYDLNFPVPGGHRPLIAAAQSNSIQLTRRFLEGGARVDAIDHEKKTALLWAAENGNAEIAQLLLDRGANIEACGKDGMSILNQASFSGRIDVVKLLLKRRAKVEAKDDDQMNCLHNAAQFGHYSVMQALLQNGVTVDEPDKYQQTALHWAARSQNSAAVDLLVLYGANVDAVDTWGSIPLHEATFKNDLDSMMVLIRSGTMVDAKSKDGLTPLHVAARDGFADAAEALVSHKASLSEKTKYGETPLHLAAWKGHAKVVQYLLAKGADVGQINEEGRAAIHIAAAEGHQKVAEVLLKGGAEINGLSKGEASITPIGLALFAEKASMIEFLLAKGSAIDVKISNQHIRNATLLHVAATRGDERVVDLLLRHKAKIDVKDGALGTPLHWAASPDGSAKMVRLLLARKASPTSQDENGGIPLHIAALSKQVESAKALLERKAKVSATNKFGYTPLHCASIGGSATLVQILIKDYGANPNAKDKHGNTPLHYAEEVDIIDMLVQGKAKTEAKNEFHQTPLHIFAQNGQLELAKMMLRRGAVVDSWDHEKVTPLMRAVFENKSETAELLLAYDASVTHKVGKDQDAVLHLAAEKGFSVVVSKILDSGPPHLVDVNIRNAKNQTPLWITVLNDHPETARMLIQHGAALETEIKGDDDYHSTPLVMAAAGGKWEMVRVLCGGGADVRAKVSKRGTTALHFAAAQGSLEIAVLLIEKGASFRETDADNNCALDYAEKYAPTTEVAGYLRSLGSQYA